MPVISFAVTVEQKAEADAYALRKGYRTAANLARVAMVQMMARYPKTARGGADNEGHDGELESQRGVRPNGLGGQNTGGAGAE